MSRNNLGIKSKMSSRVRKYSEGLPQKVGPIKATLPITSVLRGSLYSSSSANFNLLPARSPPMRHISPEYSLSSPRSPSANEFKDETTGTSTDTGGMRRTASLDALYMRPTWNNVGLVSTVLHLDKSTQTEESFFERTKGGSNEWLKNDTLTASPDIKIEKVIRQRWQRGQRGEHSVSSQTLSPIHGKASPMLIPQHNNSQIRPMRSSVEGLNQEIEKLVLYTGQVHSSRPELGLFSRGTPEGHRAPLAELFHNDMRSVNTQTPIGDILSSDESHSTSPEEGTSVTNASPRINRFLAREPPDGCEKVCLKLTEAEQGTTTHFKPCVGFQLRPSLGSAFQSLQPIGTPRESQGTSDDQNTNEQ